MQQKTATILGATGLIGSHLLKHVVNDNDFASVKVIGRRPFVSGLEKVRSVQVDFSDVDSFNAAMAGSDVVFCAIGTTLKKVRGDKEA
jgi:uncharacterized protein YbjT (DUF2867 family)